jgi:hypothetical protein
VTDNPSNLGNYVTADTQPERFYSEISPDVNMFNTQTLFGCYSPMVLASLHQATNTLAPTYDDINAAAAGIEGKSPTFRAW